MYFYLAEISKMRDPDQIMRFLKDNDSRVIDARIDETITDVMNFALRSLCSADAQRNLNGLYETSNGTMDEEARCQALAAVDEKYPLKAPQKLPEHLVYVGSQIATINSGPDGIVGEAGEISPGDTPDDPGDRGNPDRRDQNRNRYSSYNRDYRSDDKGSYDKSDRSKS